MGFGVEAGLEDGAPVVDPLERRREVGERVDGKLDQNAFGNEALAAYLERMARKLLLAFAPILLAGACATSPPPPVALQPEQEPPVFIQYRPGHSARFRLDAPYEGVLIQRGPCLGVVSDGRFSTIIWPERAQMEFDANGLVVRDGPGGARVRLGDYLEFTGGPIPKGMVHPFGEDALNVDMPMKCAHFPGYYGWIAIVNPGFR